MKFERREVADGVKHRYDGGERERGGGGYSFRIEKREVMGGMMVRTGEVGRDTSERSSDTF